MYLEPLKCNPHTQLLIVLYFAQVALDSIAVTQSGTAHAVALWWRLDLDSAASICLHTAPCWVPAQGKPLPALHPCELAHYPHSAAAAHCPARARAPRNTPVKGVG